MRILQEPDNAIFRRHHMNPEVSEWLAKKKKGVAYRYVNEGEYKKNKKGIVKSALVGAAVISSSTALGLGAGGGAGAGIGFCSGGPIGAGIGAAVGGAGGAVAGFVGGCAASAGTTILIMKKSTHFQEWKLRIMTEKVKKDFTAYINSKDRMGNFLCPISGELIEKPVRAPDNLVYDEKAIKGWMKEKLKGALSSAYGVVDFTEEDLIVDYHTCINLSKRILELLTEDPGPVHARVKSGLVNLRFDLLREIDACLEKWMIDLAAVRKNQHSCIHALLDKYARLCVEVETTPEKITDKCQAILGSEWTSSNQSYLQHVYDNKNPSYVFEQSCDYEFNTN